MRRARGRRAARRWGSRSRPTSSGNLLARVRGRGERTILLCAHLDTVPAARADRSRARRRRLGERQRRHPRRRQQGGGGDDPRDRAPLQRRGLAGRARAAVHGRRGGRPAGRQALRRRAAALGVRLRVRPRDPDRRDRHGVADAVPDRGRVPRQVRPRRHAPGVRPLGDPRRRARRRRDAARPDRRADHREPRLPARRRRVDQRRPGAGSPARRGPVRRPRQGRGGRSPA